MTLGEVIAKARAERYLSLRDLAAATGISNPALSQIETGRIADPGFTKVCKIASVLGIKLDDLAKLGVKPGPKRSAQ